MKKLFRRIALKGPGYPTHEASGLSGRAVAAAGLIVATATGGCYLGATSGDPIGPDVYASDAAVDAGRDAEVFVTDTGGVAPYPDAGEVPPKPDAGE